MAILVSVTCLGTPPAAAVNFEWATATSGEFDVASNWTQPFGPPSASDNALFNQPGFYTVSFPNGPVASGDLRVSDGTVKFNGVTSGIATYHVAIDAEITGGDLTVGSFETTGPPFNFQVQRPVNLQIADDLIVHHSDAAGISTMRIEHSSDVTIVDDLFIGAGSVSTGDGAVIVRGASSLGVVSLSTLDAPTGLINLGGFGNTGTLSVSFFAEVNLATTSGMLQIGDSGFDDTVGELLVADGGCAFVGHIEVATLGSGAIGTITVSNGADLEQTLVGANLTLGSTSGIGSATINVQDNGTFTTSTGTTTINATGTVNVGVASDGTFNANGDVNIVGGTLHVGDDLFLLSSEFNLANGKKLTASGGGLVDFNGSYNITGGTTFEINTGATFMTGSNFNPADLGIGSASGTGTLIVDGVGSTVTQSGASTLTVGSTSGTGSASINVQNGGVLTTGTGTTTINATGTVDVGLVGDGTFNANGDVDIGGLGAVLHVGSSSSDDFNLASGKTLTASDGGLVDFDNSFNITGGTTFEINTGATFTAADLDIGIGSGDGTLVVGGDASSVTATGNGARWGGSGMTANVTFRDQATGNFNDILLANSLNDATSGNLMILGGPGGGSTVNTADISVATSSGSGATGTITVDGTGSTLTQSGASTLTVGSSSGTGSATVNVQNGGTLNAGTGTTTISATGTVNLSGGALNATTIDHTGGGQFNFTGGTLSVATFIGDLTNQGGTLAPGDSPGTTSVTGDYTQVSGTLEIELGGDLAGEFDLLDVAGDGTLDGTLDVLLLGGFTPQAGDMFKILAAANVVGTFGNENLPTLAGLNWNVSYAANSVTLQVLGEFLEADFDEDGDVDGDDFLAWQTGFGLSSGASMSDGDADSDGDVDGDDFLIWQSQFSNIAGSGSSAESVLPEPASLMLLLVLAAAGSQLLDRSCCGHARLLRRWQ